MRRPKNGVLKTGDSHVFLYYRTPTGVIDHETTSTDNFLYRPKQFVLRLRIIFVY